MDAVDPRQVQKLPLYACTKLKSVRQNIKKLNELTINTEKSRFTFKMRPASHQPSGTLVFSEVGQKT